VSSRVAATSPAATRGKANDANATKRPVRVTPRAAVLLFAVFLIAMVAIAPTRAFLQQRSRLQELEREAAQLADANAVLERRIDDLNDPETLERLARECLGMVRPGETGFVTIPKDGPPTPPNCG
jgi:cell division protein FtsB